MIDEAAIAAMGQGLRPVRRHALAVRLILGMIGGGVVTLALVAGLLGFRADFAQALHGHAIWMKWAYTLWLTVVALVLTARLARPGPAPIRGFLPIMRPGAALAVISAVEMAQVPAVRWPAMWLGNSWSICSAQVLMLSLPIFAGLLWSFRQLAPTRLRAAGAAAGLAAGAWAAALYSLHCPEASALFVLTWYSLGIALAAALGAAVGPRALRW